MRRLPAPGRPQTSRNLPRPPIYPLFGPKYALFGTIYPQLRVLGGSWFRVSHPGALQAKPAPCTFETLGPENPLKGRPKTKLGNGGFQTLRKGLNPADQNGGSLSVARSPFFLGIKKLKNADRGGVTRSEKQNWRKETRKPPC